jgi:hypothetical protein
MRKLYLVFSLLFIFVLLAMANTPGTHVVTLTWTASTTTGATYNIYRGTVSGVCTGIVTPYATGIVGTTYVDTTPIVGTSYYNVSAVTTAGGESTCDGQVQVTVLSVTTQPPTSLSGSSN